MIRRATLLPVAAGTLLAASVLSSAPEGVRIVATNLLDVARPGEVVEVPAATLAAMLRSADLADAAVLDAATLAPLPSQAVDLDGDGVPDFLVFQANLAAGEERTLRVVPGARPRPSRADFRVHGRFVKERFDDFAWENDRVAFRMYGKALETWQKEPLTSSAVDVWTKRTSRLVVDDWYLVDDYHKDHGEGGDFYSAGKTRGCGGSGLWAGGRLHASANFRDSRVLAAGPIRLVFELVYEAWDAGGVRVSETKRVTLDAGSNFNRYESAYAAAGGGAVPAWAAGIKKAKGATVKQELKDGTLRTWETLGDHGQLGCGVILDTSSLESFTEADGNVLAVAKKGAPARWWAGFGWSQGGETPSAEAWDAALAAAARRMRSPVRIRLLEAK
ncbi:MAG TPA: DUF4861 family protein [Thermoanaerobaculia bacterium]